MTEPEAKKKKGRTYSTSVTCFNCERTLGQIMSEDLEGMESIIRLLTRLILTEFAAIVMWQRNCTK
jgi:hypothetical protein